MSSNASIVNLTFPLFCTSSSSPLSVLGVSSLRQIPRPIAKFEDSNSFFFFFSSSTASPLPSSIDPLLKVRFNYITCCSCQATQGYKTLRARAVLTGIITSTKLIARHDRALGKGSQTRNWL